jgi:DNA polymerase III subunit delta
MKAEARMGVTLLWGEDAFLLREAALDLFGDIKPTEVDASDWQGQELEDLATPSLFGERRGLLINEARSLSKDAIAALTVFLQAPLDPDSPLVICCPVSERAKAPAALEKLVKPVGTVVAVAVARRDLEPWLIERAAEIEVELSPAAARTLVETLGEETGSLVAALQQLGSAFPGSAVTPLLVAQQFSGLGDQKVWDLCDNAFGRDMPAAIRSLRSLEAAGDEPLMILGAIAARLRDLVRVRSLPDKMPLAQVAKAAGLRFDWQARRYRQQAGNYSMAQLLELHGRVVDADRAMKSGAGGQVIVPVLIAAIAG